MRVSGKKVAMGLTIFTQDGDLEYRFEKGGYCLENGAITISVQCEAVEDDGFPPVALFCLENHLLLEAPQVGDVYSHIGGMSVNKESRPHRAWAYFSFHADQVTQTWTVEAVEGDALTFLLVASHEDVNYYDERAKTTETKGHFRLLPVRREELWIPS